MNIRLISMFILGVVVGIVATHHYMSKDDEILEEIHLMYPSESGPITKDNITPCDDIIIMSKESEIKSKVIKTELKDKNMSPVFNDIRSIEEEEFLEYTNKKWEINSLSYYIGDDVLLNESDDIIEDVPIPLQRIIDSKVSLYNNNELGDAYTLFICNDSIKTVYDISFINRNYEDDKYAENPEEDFYE